MHRPATGHAVAADAAERRAASPERMLPTKGRHRTPGVSAGNAALSTPAHPSAGLAARATSQVARSAGRGGMPNRRAVTRGRPNPPWSLRSASSRKASRTELPPVRARWRTSGRRDRRPADSPCGCHGASRRCRLAGGIRSPGARAALPPRAASLSRTIKQLVALQALSRRKSVRMTAARAPLLRPSPSPWRARCHLFAPSRDAR